MAKDDELKQEFDTWRKGEEAKLKAAIDRLPAGSMTYDDNGNVVPAEGGNGDLYDPWDKGTWCHSPDPAERRIAEELFGVTKDTAPDGLSLPMKTKLYNEGMKQLAGTPEEYAQMKRDREAVNKASDKLWRSYQLDYPALALDRPAAVAAAAYVRAEANFSDAEMAAFMNEHPQRIAELIARAQQSGLAPPQRYDGGDRPPQHGDPFPAARPGNEEEGGSISDAMIEFQRKGGWHS